MRAAPLAAALAALTAAACAPRRESSPPIMAPAPRAAAAGPAAARPPAGERPAKRRPPAARAGEATPPAGAAPPADPPRAAETAGAGGTARADITCRRGPPPERLRVRFAPGHTASDIAVWFATTTCRRVVSSRDLLARAALTQIDALAGREELYDLLASLLESFRLAPVTDGGEVAIVEKTADGLGEVPEGDDRVVLAPAPAGGGAR